MIIRSQVIEDDELRKEIRKMVKGYALSVLRDENELKSIIIELLNSGALTNNKAINDIVKEAVVEAINNAGLRGGYLNEYIRKVILGLVYEVYGDNAGFNKELREFVLEETKAAIGKVIEGTKYTVVVDFKDKK